MSIKIEGGGSNTVNTLSDSESGALLWNNAPLLSSLIDLIYPVGCLYWSTKNTEPSTLFGGTWERIENKFILAAGSSYTAGNTGGSTSTSITLTKENLPSHGHTMSHTHDFTPSGTVNHGGVWIFDIRNSSYHYRDAGTIWGREGIDVKNNNGPDDSTPFGLDEGHDWADHRITHPGHIHTFTGTKGSTEGASSSNTGNTGSGAAFSVATMPPYLVAYCWKRTA